MTNIKMPTNKDELATILHDPEKIQAIFADKDLTRQWNEAQLAISAKENGSVLNQQIKEQLQLNLAEMFGQDGKTPANLSAGLDEHGQPSIYGKNGQKLSNGKGAIYNRCAPGAKLERDWDRSKDGEIFT